MVGEMSHVPSACTISLSDLKAVSRAHLPTLSIPYAVVARSPKTLLFYRRFSFLHFNIGVCSPFRGALFPTTCFSRSYIYPALVIASTKILKSHWQSYREPFFYCCYLDLSSSQAVLHCTLD